MWIAPDPIRRRRHVERTPMSKQRIKAQRTPGGQLLGACIAVSADDLSFIGPGVGWLTTKKKRIRNGLVITVMTGGGAV